MGNEESSAMKRCRTEAKKYGDIPDAPMLLAREANEEAALEAELAAVPAGADCEAMLL